MKVTSILTLLIGQIEVMSLLKEKKRSITDACIMHEILF